MGGRVGGCVGAVARSRAPLLVEGEGVSATVEGHRVHVGSEKMARRLVGTGAEGARLFALHSARTWRRTGSSLVATMCGGG